MKTRASIFSATCILLWSSGGCVSAEGRIENLLAPVVVTDEQAWTEKYANVRSEWFAYLEKHTDSNIQPSLVQNPRLVSPEYADILNRYFWAVMDQWVRRAEFRYVVVDELGKPVDDAVGELWDFVKLGSDLEPRFRVTKRLVQGEQRIPIKSLPAEMHFESPTRRWINISFGMDLSGKLGLAHDLLQRGLVLPPLTIDGPVRIVMPLRGEWQDSYENSLGYLSPKPGIRRNAPKQYPHDLPTILSTDTPGIVPVSKRGTYVMLDRNDIGRGGGEELDPGMLVMLKWISDEKGVKHCSFGSVKAGGFRSADGQPYRWVLVSEPRPRSVDEMREENKAQAAKIVRINRPRTPATREAK